MLQPMGSQRVRHDLVTEQQLKTNLQNKSFQKSKSYKGPSHPYFHPLYIVQNVTTNYIAPIVLSEKVIPSVYETLLTTIPI